MSLGSAIRMVAGVGLFLALVGGSRMIRQTAAQQTSSPQGAGKTEPRVPAKDYYQRSLEIYEFRKAAKSGWQRGEEIYYYKCWFCHNEYTKGAPQLQDLYKRPKLVSGQTVGDDTVKDKIRNGGPGMASYKYTLSEEDLTDLVSYLKDHCCWNSEAPPLNPRYRAR
ncbi:MAG: cytochrome c [Acidobacteria bacterium]|nr:cytochrome c [Acidobacteriota bacterium]